MKVDGEHFRTIWLHPTNERVVQLIDQRFLPHQFVVEEVSTVEQMADAIREMHVRGAGLIGASAGYGMYLAAVEAAEEIAGIRLRDNATARQGRELGAGSEANAERRTPNVERRMANAKAKARNSQVSGQKSFERRVAEAAELLKSTRPTAVNLAWAIERVLNALEGAKQTRTRQRMSLQEKIAVALRTAKQIAAEDEENCRMIGQHGLNLIEEIARKKAGKFATANPSRGGPVNILTHCNAGWLAFVDYGSALAPVYAAHDRGLPVHVWVDETRPRSQGSKLTAWELGQHGVPHTIIADGAGGHLMQRGAVDLVMVGSDRTTRGGDVANKIGTYLKALAAKDNKVPFYVALPSSSFDWAIRDGSEIPIEERGAEELKRADGWRDGRMWEVSLAPESSPAANYGFDVTPRRLVTGLITERGVCKADEKSIVELFPEHAS